MLFTLYTDDCRLNRNGQYILKYSDDTVLISLLNNQQCLERHQQGINKLVEWCDYNALSINLKKTEEIVLGPVADIHTTNVVIHSENI